MQQVKTYRFKLNPTNAQRHQLGQWMGACRYVYNLCLDYKKTLYQGYGLNLSKGQCQHELTRICQEVPWLQTVHSQTIQAVTDRLFLAYEKYFRDLKSGKIEEVKRAYLNKCARLGRPVDNKKLAQLGRVNFARKGEYQSFAFKQGVKVHATTKRIQLPKLGKIKYRQSQLLPADALIKSAVVRHQADGWYVSLAVETVITPLPVAQHASVGVDVGLKELVVLSTGEKIENPRHLRNAQFQLTRLQRAYARKQKGSNGQAKAKQALAKAHLRVKNTRQDYLHKVTTRLIRENQAITTEQLQIPSMVKNHSLAGSIHDASWGELNRQLAYKASWYGRRYEQVAPQYTSQDCSTPTCAYRHKELTLSIREWTCPACGTTHDRDVNAARNIENKRVGHTRLAEQVYEPVRVVGSESPRL
jgi:putative transposase